MFSCHEIAVISSRERVPVQNTPPRLIPAHQYELRSAFSQHSTEPSRVPPSPHTKVCLTGLGIDEGNVPTKREYEIIELQEALDKRSFPVAQYRFASRPVSVFENCFQLVLGICRYKLF